jgi:hypothetical protein
MTEALIHQLPTFFDWFPQARRINAVYGDGNRDPSPSGTLYAALVEGPVAGGPLYGDPAGKGHLLGGKTDG